MHHIDLGFDAAKAIISILLLIIAYFLKRLISRFDKNNAEIIALNLKISIFEKDLEKFDSFFHTIETIRGEWLVLKNDIGRLSSDFTIFKERIEEIPILKRDRDSAFRRVDELRARIVTNEKVIDALRERSHLFANKLSVVLLHVKKLGADIEPSLDLPPIRRGEEG